MRDKLYVLAAALMLWQGQALCAEKVDQVIDAGSQRLESARDQQQQVDAVNSDAEAMANEYRERLKVVDGLEIYNGLLGKQLANQQLEMERLRRSVTDAATIERQIMPLLVRMIDALEQFIRLDMPMLREERFGRVADLRKLVERADLTAAEKTRRVFEAYQIEMEFGNTLEAYKGKLERDGTSVDADFLRVGRVALMYRTLGDNKVGYWDRESGEWRALESNRHLRFIEQGLKMANQEVAPELLTVPVTAPVAWTPQGRDQ